MDPQLSVVIPAYNEEKSIASGYLNLKEVLSHLDMSYEIIFVDDGSTDRTGELIHNIKEVGIIQHVVNKGYGAALKTGLKAAKGEYILITDADGTYPAIEIPRLTAFMKDYDMVVGARTGQKVAIPFARRPAKWFLTKLANYLSGQKIPDLNSGLRIFRKNQVLDYFNILPNGFSFTTTITLAYSTNGLTIKYVPINYLKREGSSKISPLKDSYNFVMIILRSILFFKPLRVFVPISAVLLLSSVIVAAYSIFIVKDFMDVLTIILFISAVQLGMLGLIADLVVRCR